MVLNDFWQSTQNYQLEPQDPQLFLANARDVIAAFATIPRSWSGSAATRACPTRC